MAPDAGYVHYILRYFWEAWGAGEDTLTQSVSVALGYEEREKKKIAQIPLEIPDELSMHKPRRDLLCQQSTTRVLCIHGILMRFSHCFTCISTALAYIIAYIKSGVNYPLHYGIINSGERSLWPRGTNMAAVPKMHRGFVYFGWRHDRGWWCQEQTLIIIRLPLSFVTFGEARNWNINDRAATSRESCLRITW